MSGLSLPTPRHRLLASGRDLFADRYGGNDEAGHSASERMEGYLQAEGISAMRLVPVRKDWNEDLMAQEEST